MKLTMTFEDNDVREMIVAHFARSGFAVQNLDALCKSFEKAYPSGISVAVTTNGHAEEETTKPRPRSIDDAERPLIASELLNPEHHIRDDADESIESILKKSEALQRTK